MDFSGIVPLKMLHFFVLLSMSVANSIKGAFFIYLISQNGSIRNEGLHQVFPHQGRDLAKLSLHLHQHFLLPTMGGVHLTLFMSGSLILLVWSRELWHFYMLAVLFGLCMGVMGMVHDKK